VTYIISIKCRIIILYLIVECEVVFAMPPPVKPLPYTNELNPSAELAVSGQSETILYYYYDDDDDGYAFYFHSLFCFFFLFRRGFYIIYYEFSFRRRLTNYYYAARTPAVATGHGPCADDAVVYTAYLGNIHWYTSRCRLPYNTYYNVS